MNENIDYLKELATQKEDENWEFRAFLKQCNMSSNKIDKLVFEVTDEVSSKIDCTTCRKCCIDARPAFTKSEQKKAAKQLDMTPEDFQEQYLFFDESDGERLWRTRETPCPFLEGPKCRIEQDKPMECRDYPYLYKPDFNSRTMGMVQRTFSCPRVFQVMEELKKRFNFK